MIGDARLSLQREPPEQFDVARRSTPFPATPSPSISSPKQAFALYLHHLKPDGILAIHTSNTYLDLAPVVQLLANDSGYPARLISNGDDLRKLIDASDWVLVTRNADFLSQLDNTELIDSISVPGSSPTLDRRAQQPVPNPASGKLSPKVIPTNSAPAEQFFFCASACHFFAQFCRYRISGCAQVLLNRFSSIVLVFHRLTTVLCSIDSRFRSVTLRGI